MRIRPIFYFMTWEETGKQYSITFNSNKYGAKWISFKFRYSTLNIGYKFKEELK